MTNLYCMRDLPPTALVAVNQGLVTALWLECKALNLALETIDPELASILRARIVAAAEEVDRELGKIDAK